MTTTYHDPNSNITVEIKRTEWFEAFLADDSHLVDHEYAEAFPSAPKVKDVPAHKPSLTTPAENEALDGGFYGVMSLRSYKRERSRRREALDNRVRGRFVHSIEANPRNAGRQRGDIILSRALKQLRFRCDTCDTDWPDKSQAASCCDPSTNEELATVTFRPTERIPYDEVTGATEHLGNIGAAVI